MQSGRQRQSGQQQQQARSAQQISADLVEGLHHRVGAMIRRCIGQLEGGPFAGRCHGGTGRGHEGIKLRGRLVFGHLAFILMGHGILGTSLG
ncbi:hypothetical protein BZG21_40205, partial [Escherichia coli]|nr:hypothetical protein [Escherichia coli]